MIPHVELRSVLYSVIAKVGSFNVGSEAVTENHLRICVNNVLNIDAKYKNEVIDISVSTTLPSTFNQSKAFSNEDIIWRVRYASSFLNDVLETLMKLPNTNYGAALYDCLCACHNIHPNDIAKWNYNIRTFGYSGVQEFVDTLCHLYDNDRIHLCHIKPINNSLEVQFISSYLLGYSSVAHLANTWKKLGFNPYDIEVVNNSRYVPHVILQFAGMPHGQ